MPGVSFAGTWEIWKSSTVVWEFVTVTSLSGVGLTPSIANVEALGSSESLEDVWKIWTDSAFADVLLGTLESGHLSQISEGVGRCWGPRNWGISHVRIWSIEATTYLAG